MRRVLKLSGAVAAVLWFCLIVWGGVDLYQARQREFESAKLVGDTLSKALESHMTATVQKIDLHLSGFVRHYQDEVARQVPRPELEAELARYLSLFPEAQSFRVSDANGKYVYDASHILPPVNISDRDYFLQLKNNPDAGLVISEPLVSRITQVGIVVLARRLEDSHGNFNGIVLAAVKIAFFEQLFSTLSVGSHGSLALYTDQMQLIARQPPAPNWQAQMVSNSPIPTLIAQGQITGSFHQPSPIDQVSRLWVFRKVKDMPFILNVGIADQDILEGWHHRAAVYGGLGLLLTLALIALHRAWSSNYGQVQNLADTMSAAYREKERQSRALLNSIPASAWLIDMEGRYLAVNQNFCQLVGRTEEDLLGKTVDDVFAPAVAEVLRQGQLRTYEVGGSLREERWFDIGQGPQLYQLVRVSVFDEAGQSTGLAGVAWDITEQHQAQERQRLVAHVFDRSAEALLILDAASRVIACNETFTQLTGYRLEEMLGREPTQLTSSQQEVDLRQQIGNALRQYGNWSGETWLRKKDGTDCPVWCNVGTVNDDRQQIANVVLLISDLSERKATEARIESLATVDQMTSLPNRYGFARTFSEWLGQGRSGALLVLDMDQLARINDAFGHDVGDMLLLQVSQRLRQCLQPGDVLGRLGGDQFGLLTAAVGDTQSDPQGDPLAVEALAQRLLDAVAEPIVIDQGDVVATASVGICLFPADGNDAVALLRNADAAMHQAKKDGLSQFRFFSLDMNRHLAERLRLESDLRGAIQRNELQLHFQPQVEIAGESIVGFECLLRWQHPELGLVSPMRFIPIAEESGLILPIGAWVLEQACRTNKAWQDAGNPPWLMAVNLSAIQFHDGKLVGTVARALEVSGLDPRWLELEITESVLMQDPEKVVTVLEDLKALGVMLSIDDFGTGYSSLAYLKRFPIDKIKIDRSFVNDIHQNANDAAIVRMVIGMAGELERKVIAEGVETEEQRDFLKAHHCDEIQGYFYSRPLPQEQVLSFVSQYRAGHQI